MPLPWSSVAPYFDSRSVAHLATVMPDGSPHSAPLWIGLHGDDLVFFSEPSTRKTRNIDADPRVAVSVTDPNVPISMAILRGRVVERIDDERVWPIVDRIAQAYTGEDYDVREGLAVYVIRPDTWWAHDYSAD